MKRRGGSPIRQVVVFFIPIACVGCAPTVNLLGVYFPDWLVSSIVGVAASYAVVSGIARMPDARGLADSGLLFVGLVVTIALAVWWVCFSSF